MKRIIVVGSYNTGLTMQVERLPRSGETILGTGYSEGPGGKGSNQAVAAARLGGRVSFVGCVGRDRFGDSALQLWKSEGVDHSHVRRTTGNTGLGFVIVEKSGANAISVDPGANVELNAPDVEGAIDGAPEGSVLLVQLEIPVKTVNAAIRTGRKHGLTVILNPAPPTKSNLLELRSVDILTPNEGEFAALSGNSGLERGTEGLCKKGAKTVVVTLGEDGAFVRTGKESYRLRPPVVRAVDTTGAGDAFNGALAVAVAEGKGIREAVEFANVAGALTVTRREVIPALPRRREVNSLMRRLRD